MYRLDRMRRDYEQFTAAEGYIIGFHVGQDVYFAQLDRIPRRYTRIQRESRSNGRGYGLYVIVKDKTAKAELLKNAIRICSVADLEDATYNKGVIFEKKVWEYYGREWRGKDSVRFYQSGDITIDGREIQIKYEHARICYDRTLTNLKKKGKR